MATKRPEFTWENGFQEIASQPFQSWNRPVVTHQENDDSDAYVDPPSVDLVTSPAHNHLGVNVISNWPTLFDGTNTPHGTPSWWKPQEKVDVVICGAGPSGLGLAVSLLRQGVSFRIIDKADGPLACGRADGVQPRFLETAALFGLATEVHEEGPLIDRTAIYKDGEKIIFGRSHQSDSRYRGLHVITQGQIERIYIRDLLRHKSIVERNCTLNNIAVDPVSVHDTKSHPIRATVYNEKTGAEEVIQAKFLVGSDGGASAVRKSINVPFDGVSTDIYWGIMDCIFESDYPHAWIFGVVMSSEHGCCVIIPREDGYIRLYTKLDISVTGPISASRQAKDATFAESGGIVDAHSITPEEVLEQANRIFAPYTLKFASTLSWFSVWKISERVARTYSSPDMRIHLAGDAAHIHSVMGAFGLNASILDVANLGWKLGFAAKGTAQLDKLLPTYTSERRKHATKIIKVSGEYLRFISGSSEKVPDLSDLSALEDLAGSNKAEVHAETHASTNGRTNGHTNGNGYSNGHTNGNTNGNTNGDANGHANDEINGDSNGDANGHVEGETNGETNQDKKSADLAFLQHFFKTNGQFLLGTDCAYDDSVIAPLATNASFEKQGLRLPIRIKTGVRAPNPRLCFSTTETGYLNDTFVGPSKFHLVVFASSLAGSEVRRQVNKFTEALRTPNGFYRRFGTENFHIVLVVKILPFEYENIAATQPELVAALEEANATILFDDRSPDEDAHTTYGANHSTGGVAVIRPDLWIGTTCFPGETEKLDEYFAGFMRDV